MVATVEEARVEAHGLAPGSAEAIREELRPAVAEIVRRIVLDLAREELGRLAASLNGRPPPPLEIAVAVHEPQEPPRALAEGSATLPAATATTRRRCSACGVEKPARAFERGRGQCRACRHEAARRRYHDRQARARAAQGNGAEPVDPPG